MFKNFNRDDRSNLEIQGVAAEIKYYNNLLKCRIPNYGVIFSYSDCFSQERC